MNTTAESTTAHDRDPVCGMSVRIDVAAGDGLVAEHEAHVYHFCRTACRDAFLADPGRYAASHRHAAEATDAPDAGPSPAIDEGMRLWYESCSCCLSDAFPEVKAALDAEREAAALPPVDPGICEVAESVEPANA